ncbi:MAG: YegS/Rv2252/BmrU family lipid kinase [Oscillospiraceae bacterium]|nr:YegS/Rv2252/BmrU family lipid kinase [Oscillospiraceae bacterium]
MKKLLFVYNPYSGKGQISTHLAEIIDIFTKGGYDVTAHPTQAQNDAYSTVKSYGGEYDLIVCSGGDGTTNETIKGIMNGGHHVPVGTIPAGTINDFASSLGIPKYMPDAARLIVRGTPEYVDVGAFNDRYFTYVAAFGVFTEVSYATDQQLKNSIGALAYLIGAMKEAAQKADLSKKYTLTIECNGSSVTDDFIYGMVANSLSVGGIKGLAGKNIRMNDGLFEGLFIKKPATIIELNQILAALIKHEFDSPFIYYFKSSEFHLTAHDDIPWTLDGEYGGNCPDISLCSLHNVLKIMVDKSKCLGLED